jgi:Helix-turn-helix domain
MVYSIGVGEDATANDLRGGEYAEDTPPSAAEPVSESGWVTTEVAAEALNVSPRTVRDYIANDKLAAKPEGEGVERRWLVSIDSVQAMLEARRTSGRSPRGRREGTRGGEVAANIPADLLLTVQELQYRLGRAEARAELTERAQSSLEEEARALREERDRLRAELEEERSKGFWRRLFGD